MHFLHLANRAQRGSTTTRHSSLITHNFFLLLLLFFASCTYSNKKSEYEKSRGTGTVYLSQSLTAAQESPKEKDPAKDVLKKYTSRLEFLKKAWERELPERVLEIPFYDFQTEKSKKLRALIIKGKEEELLQKKITWDLLINTAYIKSPSIQKAYQQLQAVITQYSQATFLEEIVFSYQSFVRDLYTRTGPQGHRPSINSRYPYPSTLSLKGEILEENFQKALEQYKISFREMMVSLLKSYYQVIYLEKAIIITKSHQSLLSSIHQVIVKLYESGKTHHSVVLRVQVELSKIADQLITLDEQKITSLAAINRELSRSPQGPLGKFVEENLPEPKGNLDDFLKLAKKHNQELEIARRDVNRLELMVKLLRERFHPDFVQNHGILEEGKGTFYGTKRKDKPLNLRPMPRYWFASQESYLREIEVEKKRKEDQKQRVRDKILFQVKKVYYERDEALRQHKLYKISLLPRAEQAYLVAKKGYEGGRVTFDALIDSERVLLRFQIRLYQAVRDTNFKTLELWKSVGKKL